MTENIDIIHSPLEQTYSADGHSVRIQIYRSAGNSFRSAKIHLKVLATSLLHWEKPRLTFSFQEPRSQIQQAACFTSFLASDLPLELVMYSRHQLLLAFKRLASVENSPSNKSHCQRLNYHAQRLDFQSFEHYQRWLKSAPETSLAKLSIRLMEHVCATKLPSLDEPYFEFTPMPEGFSYYTHWIGWDKCGNEVRAPRPLNAQDSVPQLRNLLDYPIYVIESARELRAWQYSKIDGETGTAKDY